MTSQSETNSICCPRLDPVQWDDKILEWNNKKFIKDKVCAFFYMPVNFGKVMTKLNKKVTEAGALMPDWLCLTDHTSKWNMDIYLAVDKDVPDTKSTTLSGKFYCKVYEGNFKDTGKWCKDFETVVKAKGFKTKKLFMWYTTCPKCAKKYGKNYVVIISQID
ncbi:MAG: hypothetical protein HGB12_11470 [Bacteroidetes bacterium]|nr:hypothetical protein [Bacteroidota bacterium]